MSDMLQQAIIDAEALKEAATRNAETLVLEKYSNQIKEAVTSLLEQDDPMADIEAQISAASGDAAPEQTEAAEKSSVMEHIPLAAVTEDESAQVEIPLDKLLREVSSLQEGMGFMGYDAVDDEDALDEDYMMDEEDDDILEEDYLEEDYMMDEDDILEEDYLEEGYPKDLEQDGFDDARDGRPPLPFQAIMDEEGYEAYRRGYRSAGPNMMSIPDDANIMSRHPEDDGRLPPSQQKSFVTDEPLEEEYVDLEEDVFDEIQIPGLEEEDMLEEDLYEDILEALKVDHKPVKSGWKGTSDTILELAEEEILALEQDSEVREQHDAIRKAAAKLQESNTSLVSENSELKGSLAEAADAVVTLRDAVVTLNNKLVENNLTNAKLLYQNKALTSDSLNERQKHKLVEAVSNAETIEEAKVIFETLQSTVGSTSRKSQPKSLSEAVEKTSSMILSAEKKILEDKKRSNV
jgi:hypothetical protein